MGRPTKAELQRRLRLLLQEIRAINESLKYAQVAEATRLEVRRAAAHRQVEALQLQIGRR